MFVNNILSSFALALPFEFYVKWRRRRLHGKYSLLLLRFWHGMHSVDVKYHYIGCFVDEQNVDSLNGIVNEVCGTSGEWSVALNTGKGFLLIYKRDAMDLGPRSMALAIDSFLRKSGGQASYVALENPLPYPLMESFLATIAMCS
jgi:hypothetical protein